MLRRVSFLLPLIFLSLAAEVVSEPRVEFIPVPATAQTITQLREGGLVLYMRHGLTDTSIPDRVPNVDLNDCSTQRPLTAAGREVAVRIGEAIRQAGIPVGEVSASPMCRTRQTAEAAFGWYEVNEFLMYTSNLTTAEKVPRIANTRKLLSTPVAAGSNRVIVAHAPNLMDVIGYFPTPEAIVVVFKPLDNGEFEYIASIAPKEWAGLLP